MESEKEVEDKQETLAESEAMEATADANREDTSQSLRMKSAVAAYDQAGDPRLEEDGTKGTTPTYTADLHENGVVEVDDEKANSLRRRSNAIPSLTVDKGWDVSTARCEEPHEERRDEGPGPLADDPVKHQQRSSESVKCSDDPIQRKSRTVQAGKERADQDEKENAKGDNPAVRHRPADLAETDASLGYWKEDINTELGMPAERPADLEETDPWLSYWNQDQNTELGIPAAPPADRNRRIRAPSIPGAVFVAGIGADRSTLRLSEVFSRQHERSQAPEYEEITFRIEEALLRASLVNDEPFDMSALEERVRKEILGEAVEARVWPMDQSVHSVHSELSCGSHISIQSIAASSNKWSIYMIVSAVLCCVMVFAMAIGIALGVHLSNKSDVPTQPPEPPVTQSPTLASGPGTTIERIRRREILECGVLDSEMMINIGHAYCRAVALAVLDDPEAVSIKMTSSWEDLTNSTVDFLVMATHTMGRDVFEPSTGSALQFTVPFLYTGLAFGGVPDMVDCAESQETIQGNCRHLRICVGATHMQGLKDLMPATYTVPVGRQEDFVTFFIEGQCNVMARNAVSLSEQALQDAGYTGPYAVGQNVYSREPLALVSRRGDDSVFSDLLNTVVQSFFNAEARNLTQAEAIDLLDSPPIADLTNESSLVALMVQLVAEFGHYGELYERTLQGMAPRGGLNILHKVGDGGLLYFFPFGDLDAPGPNPPPGSVLSTITDRGYLACGVIPRPGFAEYDGLARIPENNSVSWSGFDVEFCKALNAAIFTGETHTVKIMDVSNDRYAMLQNGTVDVVAGDRVTLQTDVKETKTGVGFTFSAPIFHDERGNSSSLVTNQEDAQWSAFVHWIVMATIYAETAGITQEKMVDMPTVNLFGQQFKLMLIDCIAAVGSYGEIYQRTLQDLIPRSGGNLLNQNVSNPQMFAVPFS